MARILRPGGGKYFCLGMGQMAKLGTNMYEYDVSALGPMNPPSPNLTGTLFNLMTFREPNPKSLPKLCPIAQNKT